MASLDDFCDMQQETSRGLYKSSDSLLEHLQHLIDNVRLNWSWSFTLAELVSDPCNTPWNKDGKRQTLIFIHTIFHIPNINKRRQSHNKAYAVIINFSLTHWKWALKDETAACTLSVYTKIRSALPVQALKPQPLLGKWKSDYKSALEVTSTQNTLTHFWPKNLYSVCSPVVIFQKYVSIYNKVCLKIINSECCIVEAVLWWSCAGLCGVCKKQDYFTASH